MGYMSSSGGDTVNSNSAAIMSDMDPESIEFEWDAVKARANLEKHRVSFLTAAMTFRNEMVLRVDDREDYGEIRLIALGRVDLEVYRVIYSEPGEHRVRIISAQKASRDEREIYYSQILPE